MNTSSATNRSLPFFFAVLGLCLILLLSVNLEQAVAGSATWALNPVDYEHWGNSSNWVPNSVPDGPDDVATFSVSNIPRPFLISDVEVDSVVFQVNASAFTVEAGGGHQLSVTGSGVINDSVTIQNFVLLVVAGGPGALLEFRNDASAGVNMNFIIQGGNSAGSGSALLFHESSTAAAGTFTSQSATDSTSGAAFISFADNSTAADGTFTNQGADTKRADGGTTRFAQNANAGRGAFVCEAGTRALAGGGLTQFLDASSASDGTFTSNGAPVAGGAGPGITQFLDHSTAANAILIANGGTNGGTGGSLQFEGDSLGETAQVTVLSNGNLDLSAHNPPGLTIGALEGDGLVFLGANKLTIGNGSFSAIFSGVIQDGGLSGGANGSVEKIGAGKLTLSSANLYSGGTSVEQGMLVVSNSTGSATGTGAVQVNGGTLGGGGIVAGAVTLGSGSGTATFLAPAAGTKKPVTLTIQSALTFNSDATYTCTFKAKPRKALTDKVAAKGVTINDGAAFDFSGTIQGKLRLGTIFAVISNTAATPIAGMFANLPDGAILTINGNNFQASYEGGDGNDLTLTLVQ